MDIVLGVSAILISVISLVVAIHHGQIMDKMVQADTWPYLDFVASNLDDAGHDRVSLTVLNSGVGPAKIETLEVFWNGKPYGSSTELLEACCGFGSAAGLPESRGPSEVAHRLHSSYAAGKVLRAGDTVQMISYVFTTSEDAVYKRFGAAREKITYRVCYCSVFNDCWLSDGHDLDPPHVKSCLRPAVPYSE